MSHDYGAPVWFVTAETFDAEPDAFTMGTPAHWEYLHRDDEKGDV